jgi:hypothetical protein
MNRELLVNIDLIDGVLIILYIIGVVYLTNKVKGNKSKKLFILIGFEHLLFTIIYYLYSLYNVADAIGYYRRVMFVFENWESTFGQGTYFIYSILYPLAKVLNVSYFGCYFFFSFFGLIGFKLLLNIIQDISGGIWSKWYYLLLLPNLHFWTVSIGKDSLIFFGISAILHALYFKKNWTNYIVPILLVGFIRIHIFTFIFLAYLFSRFLLNKQVKVVFKVFYILVLLGSLIVVTPIIEERIGVSEEFGLQERMDQLQNSNQMGGSSGNFSDSNLLIKWIYYLTRPLFFDAHNVMAFIVSFENLLWLYMLFYLAVKIKKEKKYLFNNYFFMFNLFAFIIVSMPSAYLLTNLGIAVRQKTMVFPFLLIMMFYLISFNHKMMSINGK